MKIIEKPERYYYFEYSAVLILVLTVLLIAALSQLNRTKGIEAFAQPVTKKIVVVDAGHGGWDPGAISGSTEEKGINLLIARKLQSYLELGGAYVLMTRTEDEALGASKSSDMRQRRSITNGMSADILVSVHQNSFSSPGASGAQAFYYKDSPRSQLLADCIQKYFVSDLSTKRGGESKGNTSYYVLRHTTVPSVIVECGFISNYSEKKRLLSDDYQEKVAWAIYKGIVDYFQQEDTAPSGKGGAS